MKEIKEFEKDFGELLSKYVDSTVEAEYPEEHEFYCLVERCEDLIKDINKKVIK